ncbi:50S ribosomal protein L24 [Frigoriglobus tundricola]|uniref:Large ribosomal subunit protein uL24 n=1 Tax=Frigoriglobus tundricola TaxID=2774151 RepID=A0A6M5YUF2_9BACT|nr:50S ribosomal protein L24 [Frigoriglobus tundricola]QJW97529.1 LSU ribosomal protein L24p (L26e) [Frigoriglobus tundricola]
MFFRKDDVVEVVAGDDKGTRGKVLRVLRAKNKVVIEGVNRVYRHLKPSRRNPQGGRLSKEMPVDASNVMLIDPVKNAPTRVGVRYAPDGSKELFAKKSGSRLRVLSKPDPKYAKK